MTKIGTRAECDAWQTRNQTGRWKTLDRRAFPNLLPSSLLLYKSVSIIYVSYHSKRKSLLFQRVVLHGVYWDGEDGGLTTLHLAFTLYHRIIKFDYVRRTLVPGYGNMARKACIR